jgi:dTDP-4-dehydrorhamnose 3,5-epimerase
MGSVSVTQILITPLKRIQVPGGDVLHGMKCSDPGYVDFGEVYFSIVEGGAIKAWKRHLRMTLNFVVPLGTVLFAFIDEEGAVREEEVGENRYVRLTVPPGIWFGFKGVGNNKNMVLNLANIPHNPREIERLSLVNFDYIWT